MADSDSSPPPYAGDRDLQPFFVLRSETPVEAALPEPRSRNIRRSINTSLSPAKCRGISDPPGLEEFDDQQLEQLRHRAFNMTWLKIEKEIKNVLRRIDLNLFDQVHGWILDRFAEIESARAGCLDELTQPYPVINDEICNRIPLGLILTRNAEFVDDLLTFRELGVYLKSNRCHVAIFSHHDFETKHGIGDCIRSLLRQLVSVAPDAADISVLASWHCEATNIGKPVVIIIDDAERCNGHTLSEFIMILSEWAIKIPVILIFGVATSFNAPKKLMPSDALQLLQPFKFTSKSSHERMNSIIEAVLVRRCFGFCIGYKVAHFLRNYFTRHDGTLTTFIKALKIACVKHFFMEPLSFLGCVMLDEDPKNLVEKYCESMPNKLLGFAFDLPSCHGLNFGEKSSNTVLQKLHELRMLRKAWSSVLLCLFEVAKMVKIPLLDLFCDTINPELCRQHASSPSSHISQSGRLQAAKSCGSAKGGYISQAIQKLRDLPVDSLVPLFKKWEGYCEDTTEILDKVKELHLLLQPSGENTHFKCTSKNIQRSVTHFSTVNTNVTYLMNKVAAVMDDMVRDHLKPIEGFPFHEIVCFKHVDILQEALIGDPRRAIQLDLRQSHARIRCGCCRKSGKAIISSMHDTSIIYSLAQEHGDLINLHDWYQSFKEIIFNSNSRTKRRVQSPASRKTNAAAVQSDISDAMIQARFCLAVKELQFTGLLRMPSKRRPDCVQRVAFGV